MKAGSFFVKINVFFVLVKFFLPLSIFKDYPIHQQNRGFSAVEQWFQNLMWILWPSKLRVCWHQCSKSHHYSIIFSTFAFTTWCLTKSKTFQPKFPSVSDSYLRTAAQYNTDLYRRVKNVLRHHRRLKRKTAGSRMSIFWPSYGTFDAPLRLLNFAEKSKACQDIEAF